MARVDDRQLFPDLGVERMLRQMLHINRRELRRIVFRRLQKLGGIQQPDVLHAFGYGDRLPVMRRQQDFLTPPRCAMRCAAASESVLSGNWAMIFSSAARAESASAAIFKCQSAICVHAAAICRGGASGRLQK